MEIKTPEVKSNSEKEDMDTEIEEGQIANEWLTPGKTWRGTSNQRKNLKYEETQIISPSRFSALSVPDEEIQEMEKIEEPEVGEKDAGSEEIEEEGKDVGMVEGSLNIMGQEEVEGRKQSVATSQREILPRNSKTNHRVIQEVIVEPVLRDIKTLRMQVLT
ncbi:hypothetical protein DY000_02055005 [Brassica cretica]|uniref:Uncharacterized protein n=1 Tax=Brassica cretica TaxID=69181 RepID=A0ABQ7AEK4_BRACR|nr:hypothetical protein DY000_02055005 [Brassica cretica]